MAEVKPRVGLMDLAQMRDDPRNARKHSEAQIEQLAGAIQRFGWTQPALVDRSAEDLIVAGHGRKAAALLLIGRGETLRLPDGRPLPKGKVPFIDVSGWSDSDRRAYALADNQLALNAEWDVELLTAELDVLAGLGIDAEVLGFSDDTLDRLTAEAAAPRQPGELQDSTFQYEERFGVIVECGDADEQREVFERLRDEGLNVKVVVV